MRQVEFLSPKKSEPTDLMGNPLVDREVPKVQSKQLDAYDIEAEQKRVANMVKETENSDLPF